MQTHQRLSWSVLVTVAAFVPAGAVAQDDGPDDAPLTAPSRRAATPRLIGSHQIDRYEAIRQLRSSLRSDPGNEGDWILLGELAHEVALDLPGDQDDAYYRLSREAYENALRLDPDNASLGTAVRFAREQEQNSGEFDRNRRLAVRAYLDARRRETAASGYSPRVRVYETATPPADDRDEPTTSRGQRSQPSRPASYPVYRPYESSQEPPVSYRQFSDSYSPATRQTPDQEQPTTLRGFAEQLPGVFLNEAKRGGRGGASIPRPR